MNLAEMIMPLFFFLERWGIVAITAQIMPLLSLHNVFCTALTLYNSLILAQRWIHLYRNALIKYSSSVCARRWPSKAGELPWHTEAKRGKMETGNNFMFALQCERLHLWYFEGEITTFWRRCKKQPRGVRRTKIPAGAKNRGKTIGRHWLDPFLFTSPVR